MKSSRRLAAIMFTDIVGYTATMNRDERDALALLDRSRSIQQPLIERCGGHLIKEMGDGMLVMFDTASSAVICAGAIQHLAVEQGVRLRIGIHEGEIVVAHGDVFGEGVNIASRIEPLAQAGEIVVTESIQRNIHNKPGISTKLLGERELKNVSELWNIFSVEVHQSAFENFLAPAETSDRGIGTGKKLVRRSVIVFFVAVLGLGGWFLLNYISSKRWAKIEAPKVIQDLLDRSDDLEAFHVWEKANRAAHGEPILEQFTSLLVDKVSFESEPSGVSVFRKYLDSGLGSGYELMGKTPFRNRDFYNGLSSWMFVMPGYDTLFRLARPHSFNGDIIEMPIIGQYPVDMVKFDGSNYPLLIRGLANLKSQELEEFLIDKYEVTNKEYKEFVDDGGYQNRNYWKYPFEKEGVELGFKEAMEYLVDKTGRAGPAGWELGDYQNGMDNFPVTGVSWFEAAAYAEFAEKRLPTIYHWNHVASPWNAEAIVPLSNLDSNGPMQKGESKAISSNGIYDIVGNAREWIFNSTTKNKQRAILGGSWHDSPDYAFDIATVDSWDRSSINGFRCIKYLVENKDETAINGVIDVGTRDYMHETPVGDQEFELFLRQYDYDKQPLNAEVKELKVLSGEWTVEEIFFDAAYGQERMMAYLFLPSKGKTPFQTVIYFMGSAGIHRDKFDPDNDGNLRWFDFIIKSGRAVLFPIYQSTYYRRDKITSDYPDESNYYKERFIMRGKDLRRSIDYLNTRNDIDSENLAFYGYSWGACVGGVMAAIEPRLKCLVLSCGGLFTENCQPEVDVFNYLPHAKQPTLMLNGKYDPLVSSHVPMFALLGAEKKDKKHVLFDGSHIIPRNIMIIEVLAWLDTYLSPIGN